jgi:hypothetical protein
MYMKMAKKVLAIVMAVAVFASFSVMGMTVSAEQKDTVEGIRWFPANMDRDNGFDDMWEVECGDNTYQRFNEAESNADAAEPYLSTEYAADGSLTLARTGADGNSNYWPRIRTLYLENSPAIDLSTANTLYYDFEANSGWMIDLIFSGMELKLGQAICAAEGTATLGSTDEDGVAGTYKGSINLNDVIEQVAANSSDPHSTEMQALKNMKKAFVPQAVIFVVGDTSATLTINSLYISSEDDVNGDNCDLMDMGLVYGDEYYDVAADTGDDTSADAEPSDDDADATTTVAATTTTTKAAATSASTFPVWAIVVIAIVVVVVVVVVVVIVVSKKKNGDDATPPAKK